MLPNRIYVFLILLFLSFSIQSQESEDKSLFKVEPNNLKQNEENLKPKRNGKKLSELVYPWIGYISEVEGKVIIERHDNDDKAILATFEAEEGDLIRENDFFDIRKNSNLEITLKNNTEVTLAPDTFFKIDQHYIDDNEQSSIFNLLSGRARISIERKKNVSKIKVYSPNLVVESADTDLVVGYDTKNKKSMLACFSGNVSVTGVMDSKNKKKYNQYLSENEHMEVNTSYDEQGENYLNTDPSKMSTSYRRKVLESLNADYKEINPWEFTRISTSFLRFAPGFDYSKIRGATTTYYNFSIGYLPLMHIYSIFYIEPYFFVSLASSNEYFLRGGGNLELYLFRGFYIGGGAGAFWISNSQGYSTDLNANVGYTFSDKQIGIFDGLRLAYYRSKTPLYDVYSVIFSIVLNFSGGRDDD